MDEKIQEKKSAQSSPTNDEENLQKALAFARETAKDEIKSVERLYKRTLNALGIVLLAFGLPFSFLGWIGYSNLKHVAVQTATDVVKERLADELTQRKIDIGVQQALREHATEQIARAVHDQVAVAVEKKIMEQAPELRAETEKAMSVAVANLQPQIKAFAEQQTSVLIRKLYEPRQLDSAQHAAIASYAKKTSPLDLLVAVGGDSEAQRYEEQLISSFEDGGWKIEHQALLGSRLDFPSYGLVVATTPKLRESFKVSELMAALRAAKLEPQLIILTKPAEWGEDTVLVVLPKAR